MNKSIRKGTHLLLGASCAGLSGCTFMPVSYNASGLPESQLAFVEATGTYMQNAQIAAVFDEEGTRVVGTDSWVKQDRWKEVYLQPGRYQFVTHCQMGSLYSFPRLDVELSAGAHYKLTCRKIDNRALYGAAEALIEKVATGGNP
jgi:hypothetical protein